MSDDVLQTNTDLAAVMVAHQGHGRFEHGACSWVQQVSHDGWPVNRCDAYLVAEEGQRLADKVARAWDEGWGAGTSDAHEDGPDTPNPYRAALADQPEQP